MKRHYSGSRDDWTVKIRKLTLTIPKDTAEGKDKTVFEDINANFAAGQVTGLMGPTGAGKSCLLKCVAHRMAHTGKTSYGGRQWDKKMRRMLGYVEQDDIVWSYLTVKQELTYCAYLRISRYDRERIDALVDDVIEELRMPKCKDTKISDCSGGERKRVCIGKELLTEPRIILMDEITSGLDSSTAHIVVEVVRDLARTRNLVIIMTIHQPNSKIYGYMDRVFLFAGEGKVCFNGPAKKAPEWFESYGHPCPNNYNIADHFMDLVVFKEIEAKTLLAMHEESQTRGNFEDTRAATITKEEESTPKSKSWCDQFRILFNRGWVLSYEGYITKTTVCLYLGSLLIQVGLYSQLGYAEADVFPHFSAVLWIMGLWLFMPMSTAILAYNTVEKQIESELQVGAYRVSAYYMADSCVKLLRMMLWPSIFLIPTILIMFQPIAYKNALWKFPALWAMYWFVITLTQGLGLLFGAAFDMVNAGIVNILYLTFCFAYCGFFNELKGWLEWTVWLNPYAPILSLTAGILWDGSTWTCQEAGDFSIQAYPDQCNDSKTPAVITASELMDKFFKQQGWGAVVFILVYIVVSRVLTYFALMRRFGKNMVDDAPPTNKMSSQSEKKSFSVH